MQFGTVELANLLNRDFLVRIQTMKKLMDTKGKPTKPNQHNRYIFG